MVDVLVTGAAGFLGKALVRRLSQGGREVCALSRVDGNIETEAFWDAAPRARSVIHLAGRSYVPDSWAHPDEFMTTNVLGTQRALDWCRRHNARMVFASAYVYGIPQTLPIKESDLVRPNNPYALSKYFAEQVCEFYTKHHGISATALRIFNVYGLGQRVEFLIPRLVDQALRNSEIRVLDLLPRRDYVYLDDVVAALELALETPPGFHCVNIGSGESVSVAEVVEIVQAEAGTSWPVVSEAVERRQEIADVRADIRCARAILGWQPRTAFAEGIRQILEGTRL